jgi:hypothetical protein
MGDRPDHHNLSEIKPGDAFASFMRGVDSFPAWQSGREELLSKVKALMNCTSVQ